MSARWTVAVPMGTATGLTVTGHTHTHTHTNTHTHTHTHIHTHTHKHTHKHTHTQLLALEPKDVMTGSIITVTGRWVKQLMCC